MKGLNIAVCIKPVPDPAYYDKISVDPKTKRLQRAGAPAMLNELDRYAVIRAAELKQQHGGSITLFSMAPDDSRETLLEAAAYGADAIVLLSDRKFAGADTLATAYTLSEAIAARGPYDLILTGNESSDGGTNQVSAQLGEWLQIPHVLHVRSIDYHQDHFVVSAASDHGVNTYEVTPPMLCGVTRQVAQKQYQTLRGIKYSTRIPYEILRAADLGADEDRIGDAGSPTKAGAIYEPPQQKEVRMLTGTADEIVEQLLLEIRKAGVLQEH
ncbi:MAG: electron transfer flavoprotein subunit beta/FixA family protein [Spirochaetia bacterium]|nr:electron transfer flavoprotein subunit beta/FixA family protein [Spirochaetia bacterium]